MESAFYLQKLRSCKMTSLTLGSLFDGSGGFPLAAKFVGVKPIWASEIEPFAIRVTTKRLPEVQHLGDITQLNGASIPAVDIISFGSPCQDLSIAGGRRVFLVADFDGERARDILFESASLSRDFKTSETEGQGNTRGLETSTGETICLNDQGGKRMDIYKEKSGTLKASGGSPPYIFENHSQDSRYKGPLNQVPTLSRKLGTGGNNQPFVVYDVRQTSENTRNARHNIYPCDVSRTIDTSGNHPAQNQGGLAIVEEIFTLSKNSHFTRARQGITDPLVACNYKDPPVVNQPQVRRLTPQECGRLQGFPDGWCDGLEEINPSFEELIFWRQVFEMDKRVRRLKRSKTEKKIRKWLTNPHTDSAEYKLWGNGVALPCVIFILQGIVENT